MIQKCPDDNLPVESEVLEVMKMEVMKMMKTGIPLGKCFDGLKCSWARSRS